MALEARVDGFGYQLEYAFNLQTVPHHLGREGGLGLRGRWGLVVNNSVVGEIYHISRDLVGSMALQYSCKNS